jgi:hypothetical protein
LLASPLPECNGFQGINQDEEAIDMYFLKTDSPAHLRWLKVFEPLMMITGVVQHLPLSPRLPSCISRTANMLLVNR